MIEGLRRYVKKHEKLQTINTLKNEIDSLKEMIVEDQYEIRRLKATIKKLRKEGNNGKNGNL